MSCLSSCQALVRCRRVAEFFSQAARLGRGDLAASTALLVAGLLLFGGALRCGFTTWDDDVYVTRNPLIEELSWQSIQRIFTSFSNCNYHPLTYLTYMLEYAAVGLSPWLYHLDNVILHAAAAVLSYHLGRRWLGNRAAAFLAGLLFLVHPLRVESVAWVAERKDVLCATFYLAALLAYPDSLREGRGKARYAASLGFFLLALLSKVMAVTLPAVLALLHLRRKEPLRPQLLLLLPFAALALLFAVLGVLAQAAFDAVKEVHGGSLLSHLLSLPKALAFYAQKLAFPLHLSPRYVLPPASGLLDPRALAGVVLCLCALAVCWGTYRRRPAVSLGFGFFLLTWAPASGIVPTSTLVADRYLYLPALGLFWSLATLLASGVRDEAPKRVLPVRVGLVALALYIPFLSFLTCKRIEAWSDSETLWREALRENPQNPYAHNQLCVTYGARGRYREALEHGILAGRLGLLEPRFLFNICRAYRGLGEKEKELESARELAHGAPNFVPAWLVVARHLREEGQLVDCERLLARLEAAGGWDPRLLMARGDLERARGENRQALLYYLRSLELDPREPEAFLGAGEMLALLGDGAQALKVIERALSLPRDAWFPDTIARLQRLLEALEKGGRE